jgi:flagellar biosynthesis GTPase FlhF
MILKKFIGKTLEAAKDSAKQMYGNDFVILESFLPDEDQDAGITVAIDKNKRKVANSSENGVSNLNGTHNPGGVRFEPAQRHTRNLDKLRKIAQEQDQSINKKTEPDSSQSNGTSFEPSKLNGESSSDSKKTSLYSRSAIRKNATGSPQAKPLEEESNTDQKENTKFQPSNNSIYSRFDESKPKIKSSVSTPSVNSPRRNERDTTALHKRFDKLEALLDSALISTNLEYASHPVFQQLVKTGISTSVVAKWFSQIIEQGVDPFIQPEQFANQLGLILKNTLSQPVENDPKKYLMFVGAAGSGKSTLIMKLITNSRFFQTDHTAVISVIPKESSYYTILEPFCSDQDIPFYKVSSGREVTGLQQKLEQYDHVLIDTPSIHLQQKNSFRQFWEIRQILASLTPMEIHYVVNASHGQHYFEDASSSHHPLQPDYLAISNLDQVSKWGGIIPFLQEMNCGTRYISSGPSIPESVDTFKAENFAKRVLQDA